MFEIFHSKLQIFSENQILETVVKHMRFFNSLCTLILALRQKKNTLLISNFEKTNIRRQKFLMCVTFKVIYKIQNEYLFRLILVRKFDCPHQDLC